MGGWTQFPKAATRGANVANETEIQLQFANFSEAATDRLTRIQCNIINVSPCLVMHYKTTSQVLSFLVFLWKAAVADGGGIKLKCVFFLCFFYTHKSGLWQLLPLNTARQVSETDFFFSFRSFPQKFLVSCAFGHTGTISPRLFFSSFCYYKQNDKVEWGGRRSRQAEASSAGSTFHMVVVTPSMSNKPFDYWFKHWQTGSGAICGLLNISSWPGQYFIILRLGKWNNSCWFSFFIE